MGLGMGNGNVYGGRIDGYMYLAYFQVSFGEKNQWDFFAYEIKAVTVLWGR